MRAARHRGPAEIRHAGAGDAHALAGVLCRALKAAYLDTADRQAADAGSRRKLAALDPADLLEGARSLVASGSSSDWTVVAEVDGEVVGFQRLEVPPAQDRGTEGEVASLYVDPLSWGGGSGGRLLEHGLAELREHGCRRAWLWVAAENERAQRFYRHHGFGPDGAQQTYRMQAWGVDLGFALPVVRYARGLPAAPEALQRTAR